jgi:tetratricopeptide (TPR) repeat protein
MVLNVHFIVALATALFLRSNASEYRFPCTTRKTAIQQSICGTRHSLHSNEICRSLLALTTGMALVINGAPASHALEAPTDKDNQLVQMAFKDFDMKRFSEADKELTMAIKRWRELDRPRDEIVSLIKARANVRLDNKDFQKSLDDCNDALQLMSNDGQKEDGTARYPEYPDTFVSRALAEEGLADWNSALKDYEKAVDLWGGGRGEGINPYVLTFRGNTLCRLGRYADAIPDYEAASNRFIEMRDIARYSDARADLALALYEVGDTEGSVKAMNDVIRKNPGYADMHVAIAADAWSKGDYILALKEWRFACDRVDVGCGAYQDPDWVTTVRRWPPSLAKKLQQFLAREIPDKLKGTPGAVLAPGKV